MANTDSLRSLDPDMSAQVMEVFNDLDIDPDSHHTSPKRAPVLGSARKRSLTKLKEPSRRDSPTLPWRNPLRLSAGGSGTTTPQPRSPSPPKRADSPDIDTILARTPRPRKSSIATPPFSKARLPRASPQSEQLSSLITDYAEFMDDDSDGEGGSESDSSIDIHTPLPHLMFRDGLLSPRSKLLPQSTGPYSMYSLEEEGNPDPSASVLSFVSTAGSITTKSGLQKDPRDTVRRRQRHRDGRLLKAGMGLTTGLGWSDSEDEDAPSTLTRRLIHTTLERKRSESVTSGGRPSSMSEENASRFTSPVPPLLSRKLRSHSNLRSSSVSFPATSPVSPAIGPGVGPRIPRGRAASAATPPAPRNVSSPLKMSAAAPFGLPQKMKSDSNANPSILREVLATSPDPIPTQTFPRAPPSVLTRKRAESSASTASVATSPSLASPSIESLRSAVTATTSTDSLPSSNIHPIRKRTESSASNSTTTTSASVASTYSQNSSSTSVPSSTSSGYRPLRLPQSAGLSSAKPPTAPRIPQRSRTLSNSALPLPSSFVRRTTSGSTFSGVLPAGSPPALRQRPLPGGARAQPRTGTGMVYRTSSHASFHEAGNRMRAASVVTTQS